MEMFKRAGLSYRHALQAAMRLPRRRVGQ